MRLLSQGSKYAISAVIALSRQRDSGPVPASGLAKPLGCPPAYLSQILSKLKPAGIIRSRRGVNGGVYLNRSPRDISLYDIVEAIDGSAFFRHCFLGIEGCGHIEPCPFHAFWSVERDRIRAWLQETTFDRVNEAVTDAWFSQHLHFSNPQSPAHE